MALGQQIQDSLKDAEANLRNALAYAARTERAMISVSISKMIQEIDNLTTYDTIMDKLEDRESGDSGQYGPFFDSE